MRLAQSKGNRDITFGHRDEVVTSPTPPDASKGPAAVMQAIDEWLDYNDQLQLATMTTQPSKCEAPTDGAASTGTDKETTNIPPPGAPPSTLQPKKSIKRLSWTAGFLSSRKIAQPKQKQVLQSPKSNSQPRVASNRHTSHRCNEQTSGTLELWSIPTYTAHQRESSAPNFKPYVRYQGQTLQKEVRSPACQQILLSNQGEGPSPLLPVKLLTSQPVELTMASSPSYNTTNCVSVSNKINRFLANGRHSPPSYATS